MSQTRHVAVVAGLALTLTLGAAPVSVFATQPQVNAEDGADDPASASSADNAVGVSDSPELPAPADYDKSDFYQGGLEGASLFSLRTAPALSPMALSDEMKYFCKFESGCNYDQGFSRFDGYNALGYYQFDRRYGLMSFIRQAYNYNPSRYAMFAGPLDNAKLLSSKSASMYDPKTKKLIPEAQQLEDAWHAAYAANPAEFSALQDAYAYKTYYEPIEELLDTRYGIKLSKRSDCVKGLMWGLCNLFGYTGCQDYLRDAKISESMSDAELVTAVCDTVVKRVGYYCSSQPEYWEGWRNRYRSEKKICLDYIAQHGDSKPQKPSAPSKPQKPSAPQTDEKPQQPSTPDAPQAGEKPQQAPGSSSGEPGADQQPSKPGKPSVNDGAHDDDGASGDADAGAGDSAGTGGTVSKPSNPGSTGGQGSAGSGPAAKPDAPAPDKGDVGSGNVDPNKDDAPSDDSQNAPGASGGQTSDGKPADTPNSGDAQPNDTDGKDDASDSADKPAAGDHADKPSADAADGEKPAGDTSAGEDAQQGKDDSTEISNGADEQDAAASSTKASEGDLPQTGDIAGMVMMGAAGFAVAGGSFVSLGRLERGERRDSNKDER